MVRKKGLRGITSTATNSERLLMPKLELPGQPKVKPRLSGQFRAGLPGSCSCLLLSPLPSLLWAVEKQPPHLLLPSLSPRAVSLHSKVQFDTAPHVKVFIFLNTNNTILLNYNFRKLAGPQNLFQLLSGTPGSPPSLRAACIPPRAWGWVEACWGVQNPRGPEVQPCAP